MRGCIGSAEPLDEDIDVIFIGVVSPRRKRIIDALIKCAAATTHPPTRLCAVSTATSFGAVSSRRAAELLVGPSRILCVEYRVSQGFCASCGVAVGHKAFLRHNCGSIDRPSLGSEGINVVRPKNVKGAERDLL